MQMDVTRLIQVAVVRIDMALCAVLAWPWKRMALSLLLAWWTIKVARAVVDERRRQYATFQMRRKGGQDKQ